MIDYILERKHNSPFFPHYRVRQAIERKDEALLEMRRNYERVLDQCNHLETLLHRQTKETYVKPNGNQVQSKP